MNKLTSINRKIVFHHPWETIAIETVQNEQGDTFEYLISEPNEFVIIVPFLSPGNILMVKQYKHGAQKRMLGFPAGFMKKNEKPLQCARRELLEETGYKAVQLSLIAELFENPTRCRNKYYIVFAKQLLKETNFDANSDLLEGTVETLEMPIKQLLYPKVLKLIEAGPMLSATPFIYKSFIRGFYEV